MGCRVLFDRDDNIAALYCSTTGVAFGETFGPCENDCCDALVIAELFLEYLRLDKHVDPRTLDPNALSELRRTFAEGGLCMNAEVAS